MHLVVKVRTIKNQKPLWNISEKLSSNWTFQDVKDTKVLFFSEKEMEKEIWGERRWGDPGGLDGGRVWL